MHNIPGGGETLHDDPCVSAYIQIKFFCTILMQQKILLHHNFIISDITNVVVISND